MFAVVKDGATYVRPVFTPRGRRLHIELPPKNSLSAYDLRGGKRLWRLAEIQPLGPSSTTPQSDHDVDFLGPPLACGGTLYVLGRTNDGANLLALDPAGGTVRWGKNSGFSGFEADFASWFGPACVPVEKDGLLFCPTPEGIVVAVICQRAPAGGLSGPTDRRAGAIAPGDGGSRLWRPGGSIPGGDVVRLDDRRCFVVSPGSAAIHALAIDSGKLIWTQPVANGLFLGPIVDGRLLAFSQYRALAFDAATGRLLWSSESAFPAGAASHAGGVICFPKRPVDWRPSTCKRESSTFLFPTKATAG